MSEQVEGERRLANMLRLGTILDVDYANATARVESGGIQTDFLPWFSLRAGNVKIWSPPSIGEQVAILSIGGEFTTACILPGIYASNAPNQSKDEFSIHFPDGAVLQHNFASGHFSLKNCKTAEVHASGKITITCPTVTMTGNLNVKGGITADGDVKAGEISLKSHKHTEQGDGKDTTAAK